MPDDTADKQLDCDSCFEGGRSSATDPTCEGCSVCYKPFSTVKTDMKGVCMPTDVAVEIAKSGDPMPLPVRSFLYNLLMANYMDDKNDAMIRELRLAVFGDENKAGSDLDNVEMIVQDGCASADEVEEACSSNRRFLEAMHPEESKTVTFRPEYLRTVHKPDTSSSEAKKPRKDTSKDNFGQTFDGDGRARAHRAGLSDKRVDDIMDNLKTILQGQGMADTEDVVTEKVSAIVSDPKVLEQVRVRLESNMAEADGPAVEIASRLLESVIDKDTGSFDESKFSSIHSELHNMKDGDFKTFSSSSSGSMRILVSILSACYSEVVSACILRA